MKHNQERQWVSWATEQQRLCNYSFLWVIVSVTSTCLSLNDDSHIVVCAQRMLGVLWVNKVTKRPVQSSAVEEVIIPRWGIDCTVKQDEVQHTSMTTFASQVFHHRSNRRAKRPWWLHKKNHWKSINSTITSLQAEMTPSVHSDICKHSVQHVMGNVLYISIKLSCHLWLNASRNNCSFTWWR